MAVKVLKRRQSRRISPMRVRENIEGWLFIGPVILGVLGFQFFPVLVSMYASLTRWDGINPSKFIGVYNFVRLITNDQFFKNHAQEHALLYLWSHPAHALPCALPCPPMQP